jgi:hypothetical protein
MNRLHAKGYISNPKSKALSVALSEEGLSRAKELFETLFAKTTREPPSTNAKAA